MLWLEIQNQNGAPLYQGMLRYFPVTVGSATTNTLCSNQPDLPAQAFDLTPCVAGWSLRTPTAETVFSADVGFSLYGLRLIFHTRPRRLKRIWRQSRPVFLIALIFLAITAASCAVWHARKTQLSAAQPRFYDLPYPGQILWPPAAQMNASLSLHLSQPPAEPFLLGFYARTRQEGRIKIGSLTVHLTPGQARKLYVLVHAAEIIKPYPVTWHPFGKAVPRGLKLQDFSIEPTPADCEAPPLPGTREAKILDHLQQCLAFRDDPLQQTQYTERRAAHEKQLGALLYELRRTLRQGEPEKARQVLRLYRELIDDPQDPRAKAAERLLKQKQEDA